VLSSLYAAVARRRRERYAARPDLRRRLRRPVVSIGNLAVGGRGKTPLVATVARILLETGERPAVLSRGYARQRPGDGVVVVSDPGGVRAGVAAAGDEPLMLAQQLPGVPVLASPDRYLAGRLAEHHFGATIHVLDDGFQHLQLERDVDLLILGREDIARPFTLPRGRLREPLDTMIVADALLAADADVVVEPDHLAVPVFRLRRTRAARPIDDGPVLAVAGIAAPDRFFDDLRADGWNLAGTLAFPDHHRYGRRDLARIVAAARTAGAARVVTTGKDLVRLLPLGPLPLPVEQVPLRVEPEPFDEFRRWLEAAVRDARDELAG
jgi:tetraacyldisaccharide 4'-kinase